LAKHLGHAQRVALGNSTSRPSGEEEVFMTGQGGGGHLAASHAVDGVVDENDGDVFAASGGMNMISAMPIEARSPSPW
jgi:hypothetical protein